MKRTWVTTVITCLIVSGAVLSAYAGSETCGMKSCAPEELTSSAKKALEEKGIILKDVNIIYDEGNKRWEEWGTIVAKSPADPNNGNLPKGELANKKYQTVYFDFIDDTKKDIWVFVDADTGSVLTIYEKK